MRLSRYFLPVMKDTPAEAQIVSHRLMLRAGLIRQMSSGIYAWLPLGHKVLQKISAIVSDEMAKAGAVELLMPTLQSADLWRESGRYDAYGEEMLRITDRHDRDMLFGPTNEEMITDIVRQELKSYKDLPLNLFHIQWKFRDEIRPRFGVMRGREFLMKDAYSFDLDFDASRLAYNKMFVAYLRMFDRMGLQAIPMRADTGPIGGDLSHEFIVLADTGESEVFLHKGLVEEPVPTEIDYEGDLTSIINSKTNRYAATDEIHDAAKFEAEVDEADRVTARGIEVGHIFHFGTKYSEPMNAKVQGPNGELIPLQMGSYGVGISRLLGAIVEASHDDDGIIWPEAVAPYQVGLISLRPKDETVSAACDDAYAKLTALGVDTLYDDRDERPGAKFATMDLIGLPWQMTIGPKGIEKGVVELKRRATGEKQELPLDKALELIAG